MRYVFDIHLITMVFRVNGFEIAIPLEDKTLQKKHIGFRRFIIR